MNKNDAAEGENNPDGLPCFVNKDSYIGGLRCFVNEDDSIKSSLGGGDGGFPWLPGSRGLLYHYPRQSAGTN